jgi:hypothetical protein
MTRLRSAALLVAAALLAGCEKGGPQDILGAVPGSRVKFFNFGVNTPSVNFYAGNQKMTAISSTTGVESTIGTASGAAGAGGLYTGLTAGQYPLTARISAATDKDLPISTVNQNLENGKAYSFYVSGIYNTTSKTADAFVIEDPIPEPPDYTVVTLRFVNAISNSQAMQLVVRNPVTGVEAAVGTAVPYKGATQFVSLPANSSVFVGASGTWELITRAPGSTTNLVTRTGVGFSTGRAVTVTARGDMTVTSTTAATRPQLDITSNR